MTTIRLRTSCARAKKVAARHNRKNIEAPPKKRKKDKEECVAGQKKNGLEDKKEKTKSRRSKTLHYGSVPVYILQQRKECHGRFDASVGVHSQSLGHRHVGNPATASVARTLAKILAAIQRQDSIIQEPGS